MLLNKNKQTKYFSLNTNDKTDTTKWNIPTNYNFSQKAKMALVSINNATDSNLNMVFCPTIKNNYFSSLNTPPLIYAGVGYNNQNIINGKQYYDVNGAYLNEIELKTYSSAPQNDFSYPVLDGLDPIIWYKFDNSTNIGLDSMGKANLAQDGTYPLQTYDNTSIVRGSGSIKSVSGQKSKIVYSFGDVIDGFTVSFWIKINTLGTNWDFIFQGFPNEHLFYLLRYNQTSNINVGFFGSGSVVNTHYNGEFVADNKWKYFTITAEKLGTAVKINSYLNGVFNATSTSGTWDLTTISTVYLNHISFPLLGNLDDIRMYNKVLNQDQVNTLYTNTRINYPIIKNEALKLANPADNDPNIHTVPNLWCQFETGTFTTNSGTDGNTVILSSATSAGVSVRGNNSASFNGANQYMAYNLKNVSNNSFSISFWGYAKVLGYNNYFCIGYNQQTLNKIATFYTVASGSNLKYQFNFWINDCGSINDYNDLNTWVHFVLTYNNITKERSVYRNGVKIALDTPISTSGNFVGENYISLGVFVSGVNWLNGYMDDFRIYGEKVLDQEEITRIYTGAKTNYTTQITEPTIGMDLTPNIWCKFDTGALITNSGSDTTTITNNGTATNAGVSVRGNDSISFNGTSQWLTGTVEGNTNNSWSVSFWCYPKTGTNGHIFNLGGVNANNQMCFIAFNKFANTYSIGFYGNDAYSNETFPNDFNTWVHIVAMYNLNTRERSLYRNGVKLTVNVPISVPLNCNNVFAVGRFQGGATEYYNGYVDDLRIYTGTVLSQQQITDLYQGNTFYNLPTTLSKYSSPPIPIIWYKFDDSNNIGKDSAGKINAGREASFGLPTFDNGSCRFILGQTLITRYNFSDISTAMTLSFWIKITAYNPYGAYDTVLLGAQPRFYIARDAAGTNFDVAIFGSGYQKNTHFNGLMTNDNTWRHFTFVVEKIGTAVKITSYLNGVYSATATTGTWDTTGITEFNMAFSSIGYIGNMDDFRIYNVALSADQVKDVYNRQPTETQYQFEVVDEEQKIISHY